MSQLACAQENIKPVHIGDTVPDIAIRGIRNYGQPAFNPRHFKGQLLILDFWANWCTACLDLMPELDSLSHGYSGKLAIVSVTGNDEASAKRFMKRFSKTGASHLPAIFGDSVLSRMFPHAGVPHEVWIDSSGVVRAITDGRYVKRRYVDRLLDDPRAMLPLKRDFLGFDPGKPLLVGGNGGPGDGFSYRSMITPFLEGVTKSGGIQDYKESVMVTGINFSILGLYKLLLPMKLSSDPKRIRLKVRDSSRYLFAHGDPEMVDAWVRAHTYCYQLILPAGKAKQIERFARQDLDRYFGLHTRVASVPVHCLLLTKQKGRDSLRFTPIERGGRFSKQELRLAGEPMDVLRSYLNDLPRLPVVLDRTGYKGKIYMRLGRDTSLPALQRALGRYGLTLVPSTENIRMFILSEK